MTPEYTVISKLSDIAQALDFVLQAWTRSRVADVVDPTELILTPSRVAASAEGAERPFSRSEGIIR